MIREWLLTRSGMLTGYWFWILYEEGDSEMSGPIHSVEVVHLRHRKMRRVDRLWGTAWRLFAKEESVHRSRRWSFEGHCDDPVVWGSYVWTRERDGAGGTTDVLRVDKRLAGAFTREERTTNGHAVEYDRKRHWTRWVQVPDHISPRLRKKLDFVPVVDANRYPWRIRRRLLIPNRGIGWLAGALALSVSPIDNRLALSIRESERAPRECGDDDPPLELCDFDDYRP